MTRNTQMSHARQGEITDAMRFVAAREELAPETVRAEVARGRLVIPANVKHLRGRLEPMGIGTAYAVWTGIGAVGAALAGLIYLGEPRNAWRILSIVLIVAGIAGLKLTSRS